MPKFNIAVKFSLKYSISGLRKKDEKNIFMQLIIELNSVDEYTLGKFDRKQKLDTILDKEIKLPKNKERKKL